MKLSAKLKLATFLTLLAAVPFVAGMYSERVSAHGGEHTEVAQALDQKAPEQAPASDTYTYVAQPGDSYSLMARKAIQTYGIVNKANLSPAQIIYAETLLTQEANSPHLIRGQQVTIKVATVKNWVDKAGALSDTAKAAWQVYANGVDFNTNRVGQAS